MKTVSLLLGFSLLLFSFTQKERKQVISVREKLVGTWKLVSTEYLYKDGTRKPYSDLGPRGQGYLIYTQDGNMCAELMNPDRPGWKDPDHPTDQEKISAIDGFSAYCGKYEVDEAHSVIYHFPDVAWEPSWLGTKQKRPYKLTRDTLTFSDKEVYEPRALTYSITWKKVNSKP